MSVRTKLRTPTVRFDEVPGWLPEAVIPDDVDLDSIAVSTLEKLGDLKESYLTQGAIWRDHFSLTGYLRTINSSRSIYQAFNELTQIRRAHDFHLVPNGVTVFRLKPSSWINIEFTFKIHGELAGQCAGYVSVVPSEHDPGDYRIWMLRTWLENFDGLGHPDICARR